MNNVPVSGHYEWQQTAEGTIAHRQCGGQVTMAGKDAVCQECGQSWFLVAHFSRGKKKKQRPPVAEAFEL